MKMKIFEIEKILDLKKIRAADSFEENFAAIASYGTGPVDL